MNCLAILKFALLPLLLKLDKGKKKAQLQEIIESQHKNFTNISLLGQLRKERPD